MATFQNETFANKNIVVDGNVYTACTFSNCALIYKGGDLPTFDRCKFSSTGLQLDDAAQDTLDYLSTLSAAGLFTNVDGVVAGVKSGELPISSRPVPCDARDTGTNYGQLGIWVAASAVVILLLIAGIWYGYIYHPSEVVLGGEDQRPLEAELPLDVMPVLPDNLAVAYDDHVAGQTDTLSAYSWMDEDQGIAQIPIDEAMSIIAEEGLPQWSATGG